MKKLAPEIYRQRLIIEGFYTIELTPSKLEECLKELSAELGMTIIFGPIVKDLAGAVNPVHKGFECVLIWAESGAAFYTWNKNKFFTIDIYTCKRFDPKLAVKFMKNFLGATEIVSRDVS